MQIPGHLRSQEVTWRFSCHVTASCELQRCRKSQFTPVFGFLQPLPWDFGQITSLRVTFGHLRSRDLIFCHVTASCKLQPCRKWNALYTQVFCLEQPLPGDFWSNDVTSGSPPVIWGHVTSFPVTWLPPPASYSLVGSDNHNIRQFSVFYSHFQVTSGEMMSIPGHFRLLEVTLRHFLSSACLLLRATAL